VSKVLSDVRVVFSLRAYPVIFHVLCDVMRFHLLQVSQTLVFHEPAWNIKLHEVTCWNIGCNRLLPLSPKMWGVSPVFIFFFVFQCVIFSKIPDNFPTPLAQNKSPNQVSLPPTTVYTQTANRWHSIITHAESQLKIVQNTSRKLQKFRSVVVCFSRYCSVHVSRKYS